jgi:parallel beta-helix repeat protein
LTFKKDAGRLGEVVNRSSTLTRGEIMKNLKLIMSTVTILLLFLSIIGKAEASVPNNSVTSTKVVDESLTGADVQNGTLTGADIQDNSLTGTDIQNGSITRSDAQPIARQVVVASSGGDYTSVNAALAAITPSAANPYVIEVMPGTYTENVTMKSYVHLRGAGRDVTTIQSPSSASNVITLNSLTNVAISGLTITGGNNGIENSSTSPMISDNTITGNSNYGIHNTLTTSSSLITNNTITNNGFWGIFQVFSSATITANMISGNGNGIHNGGLGGASSPLINGNTITGNVGIGIFNTDNCSPTIIHNKITGNGETSPDISVDSTSVPNISWNIYDDISGTTGVGQYNVNSNGDPAPAP